VRRDSAWGTSNHVHAAHTRRRTTCTGCA
jgi:hypothetical protein